MINEIINLGISKREAEELLKVSKNINEDIKKLKTGYPIQYLIGYVEFYGYKVNVNENVLIPRFETELLVEKMINYINKKYNNQIKILDLCTGSGAISITLKKELNAEVTASDISEEALNIAQENAKCNDINIEFIKSDIFENIKGKYDVIISNPPYISDDEQIMKSVYDYEPHIALFANNNGLYFYEEILKNAKSYLNDKFIIGFEIGYKQGLYVSKIAKKYFDNCEIIVEKDFSQKDRYVFIISE